MMDPSHPIAELMQRDRRFHVESYVFVLDALRYAQEVMGLGEARGEERGDDSDELDAQAIAQRHVSGQELCEAIRRFALEQYGFMAKSVLNHWGVQTTRDFGAIVFNLIDIGHMRKTPSDRLDDFNNVFDFDEGLKRKFRISPPKNSA
jgi:uncharacterized repeat protein (TIGR04138 family)